MVTSPRGLNVCRVEFNYCRQVQLLSFLEAFYFQSSFSLVDALKVQSSNSNTIVSRVQVHSLSEGPIRSLGVHLTCRSMHFLSSEYQTIAHFNSAITDCQFHCGNLYRKRRTHLGSHDPVIPLLGQCQVFLGCSL